MMDHRETRPGVAPAAELSSGASRASGASFPRRPIAFAALVFVLLASFLFACSETHEPLDWQDSLHGDLESLDTLRADTLIAETAQGTADVETGFSPYLLAGRIVRAGQDIVAEAYMRWDTADLDTTVESAYLVMHLAAVDQSDTTLARIFSVELFPVLGPWSEDSLVMNGRPLIGETPIATDQIDASALAGDTVVTLNRVFSGSAGSAFAQLVEAWRDGSEPNYGVVMRAGAGAPEGILRLFSAEGIPTGTTTTFISPSLTAEMIDESSFNVEADDDAFLMQPMTGGVAAEVVLPDSLALVSAGYIHRFALRFDLGALAEAAGEDPEPDIAILQGVLRLTLAGEDPWSLADGESMTLSVYPAEIDWEQADPMETVELRTRLLQRTLAGEEESVTIPIASFLQEMLEGGPSSLVILASTELLDAKSVVFKDLEAAAGRPEVELTYARFGGRLDD